MHLEVQTPAQGVTKIELEHAPCPGGCPVDDRFVLRGRDRLHDLPGEFDVVRCNHCGLMRTNPRPTAATIGLYYPTEYAPYHSATKPRKTRRRAANSAWWQIRFKQLAHLIGVYKSRELPCAPPGHMLEIGCANGAYLTKAAADGWQVSGIDFSEVAAQRARDAGFKVQSGAIEALATPDEPYDIITGWMVFEHLHNPAAVFQQLRGWVHDASWLVCSVPDVGALEFKLFGKRWYALQLPTHMTHFTPRTIRALLVDNGWVAEKIYWEKNPNNFLNSLRYWALDARHPRLAQFLQLMIRKQRLRWLHRLIGLLMAVTHQSGRMVVWARPLKQP